MSRTATAAEITLDVIVCATNAWYRATFTGADAERHALAFMAERGMTHAFAEREDAQLDADAFPALYAKLYPTCPHGLSEWLCSGPGHYSDH